MAVERHPAVEQDELRRTKGGVVEHGIEEHRIGSAVLEELAAARARVDMDGEPEAAGLTGNISKQVVLQ